jgi:acetyl/propionyl-CoA carboxylase alpha subunit
VYIERFVERPRHIEVQIFGDAHGDVVALGERECSLQRRHQKIVEESPAPAFDGPEGEARRAEDPRRRRAHRDKAAGYVGAGTVRVHLGQRAGSSTSWRSTAASRWSTPSPRCVTGLDLVEHQLRVAAGERLADAVRHATPRGHAIEARVYAEDPAKGFLPRPGDIDTLVWPEGEHIRVDAGVAAPTKVTPFYDPMIAKVLAWAPDRATAIARLGDALAATQVAPLVNNLVFLQAALKSEEFASGQYDTTFAEAFAKRK